MVRHPKPDGPRRKAPRPKHTLSERSKELLALISDHTKPGSGPEWRPGVKAQHSPTLGRLVDLPGTGSSDSIMLTKMATGGLLEAVQPGRGYRITEAGMEAVSRWKSAGTLPAGSEPKPGVPRKAAGQRLYFKRQ